MPTRRGWLVLASSPVIAFSGRLFGIQELFEIAMAAFLLPMVAVALVRMQKQVPSIKRSVFPRNAPVGTPITARIEIINRGDKKSSTLVYHEDLPEKLGGPQVLYLTPLKGRSKRTIDLDLTPQTRGRFRVGPGSLWFQDPFALARSTGADSPPLDIIVYPLTERLDGLKVMAARASGGATRSMAPSPNNDEFFTLRQYRPGDDLKRVHWPSTARIGKFMIREQELTKESSIFVVLDDSFFETEDHDLFDAMVSSAATVARHHLLHGFATSLVMGTDASRQRPMDPAKGERHLNQIMERLATAEPHKDSNLEATLQNLDSSRSGSGPLVVVTGNLSSALGAIRRLRLESQSSSMIVLHSAKQPGQDNYISSHLAEAVRSGIGVVVVGPGETLGLAWSRDLSRSHLGAMA